MAHSKKFLFIWLLILFLFFFSITWIHFSNVVSMFQSITVMVLLMLKLSQLWPVGSSVKLVPLPVLKIIFFNQYDRLESGIFFVVLIYTSLISGISPAIYISYSVDSCFVYFPCGITVFTPIIKTHSYKWNVFGAYCQSLPATTSLSLSFSLWSSLTLQWVLK